MRSHYDCSDLIRSVSGIWNNILIDLRDPQKTNYKYYKAAEEYIDGEEEENEAPKIHHALSLLFPIKPSFLIIATMMITKYSHMIMVQSMIQADPNTKLNYHGHQQRTGVASTECK